MIRAVNSLQTRRVATAAKPRNPVLAALKASQGAKAGALRKKRGAWRRAENVAMAKRIAASAW